MARKKKKKKVKRRSHLAEVVTHLPPVVLKDRRAPKGGTRNRQKDYLDDRY